VRGARDFGIRPLTALRRGLADAEEVPAFACTKLDLGPRVKFSFCSLHRDCIQIKVRRAERARLQYQTVAGANRDFILNRIPHISRLMVDGIDRVLDHAQTIVIGNEDPKFTQVPARMRDGQVMVDFVRIADRRSDNGNYDGICW